MEGTSGQRLCKLSLTIWGSRRSRWGDTGVIIAITYVAAWQGSSRSGLCPSCMCAYGLTVKWEAVFNTEMLGEFMEKKDSRAK